jgi:hypothetical protein
MSIAASEHEKTEPSIKLQFDPKVYGLLVEEEQARGELLPIIDRLVECKIPSETFVATVEQVLIAVKDYMKGVKEMGDLIKQG